MCPCALKNSALDLLGVYFGVAASLLPVAEVEQIVYLLHWQPSMQISNNGSGVLQARMMYSYKLPNGITRLSGKAAYYADVSEAYAEMAKVRHSHAGVTMESA